jgi:hypothetical protein
MPSYNCGVYRLVSGRAKTVSRVEYARHDRCQTVHFGCCVAFLSLATFRTWPLAQSLSTPIPSDAGDPILNTWLFWWTRGRDPVRRAMVEAACVHSVAGHRRAVRAGGRAWASSRSTCHWLRTSAGAAYNIAFILSFALSVSCQFPVSSGQSPLPGHRLRASRDWSPNLAVDITGHCNWQLKLTASIVSIASNET